MASSKSFTVETASRMESILQCPICLELLKDPRVLICGHTFCDICLRRLIGRHARPIPCPTCRKYTTVANMPAVCTLKEVVEAHKNIVAALEAMPKKYECDGCKVDRELDDLWACKRCPQNSPIKLICSKCLLHGRHGECDATPDNLTSLLADKQRRVAEWQQTTSMAFDQLARGYDRFWAKFNSIRDRITTVRILLREELSGVHGETALRLLHEQIEVLKVHTIAVTKPAIGDRKALIDGLTKFDDGMDRIDESIHTIKFKIQASADKFDLCDKAITVFIASIRDALDREVIIPPREPATSLPTAPPETAEEMIESVWKIDPRDDQAAIANPEQSLIVLDENGNQKPDEA